MAVVRYPAFQDSKAGTRTWKLAEQTRKHPFLTKDKYKSLKVVMFWRSLQGAGVSGSDPEGLKKKEKKKKLWLHK